MWRIIEAYDQINAWIRASEGQFIELDNGESYRFMRKRIFTAQELESFEQRSGIELPAEYKRFLIGVGGVELFVGPLTAGIKVIGPDEIEEFSREVFKDQGKDLYPDLLLGISIAKLGHYGGFRPNYDRDERFGVFYPEIPADQWIEECEFGAFDDWIANLVDSRGRTI
ncbi:SMI1/KNR4 family protein [Saccharibacillus sp. JS10]|uniref:SMI1/KNR4 family protein n=1 Tax=Saccharibacillus sp. JS10 TaxID=2950552 RepID=UPI002108CEED|nr:SMI1/KNR4 family protein [Saccharibacillus sp. JS10]MCQ4087374.1 SMI1/KNR4 family protein [Saccharibacillus sp. JS10]